MSLSPKKKLLSGIQAVKVQTREQSNAESTQAEETIRAGFIDALPPDCDRDEALKIIEAVSQTFQEARENCPPLHREDWPRPDFGISAECFGDSYRAARTNGLSPKEALLFAFTASRNTKTPIPKEPIQ